MWILSGSFSRWAYWQTGSIKKIKESTNNKKGSKSSLGLLIKQDHLARREPLIASKCLILELGWAPQLSSLQEYATLPVSDKITLLELDWSTLILFYDLPVIISVHKKNMPEAKDKSKPHFSCLFYGWFWVIAIEVGLGFELYLSAALSYNFEKTKKAHLKYHD